VHVRRSRKLRYPKPEVKNVTPQNHILGNLIKLSDKFKLKCLSIRTLFPLELHLPNQIWFLINKSICQGLRRPMEGLQ
jgi:hypothetical protein